MPRWQHEGPARSDLPSLAALGGEDGSERERQRAARHCGSYDYGSPARGSVAEANSTSNSSRSRLPPGASGA